MVDEVIFENNLAIKIAKVDIQKVYVNTKLWQCFWNWSEDEVPSNERKRPEDLGVVRCSDDEDFVY
jgi:hypothetical protein